MGGLVRATGCGIGVVSVVILAARWLVRRRRVSQALVDAYVDAHLRAMRSLTDVRTGSTSAADIGVPIDAGRPQ
jgi:hypothetical protein